MSRTVVPKDSEISVLDLGDRIRETLKTSGILTINDLLLNTFNDLYKINELSTTDIIKIRRSLMIVGYNLDESPVERVDHWLNAVTYPQFKGKSRESHIREYKDIESVTVKLDHCGNYSILGAVMCTLINLPYRPKRFLIQIGTVAEGVDVSRDLKRAHVTLGTEAFVIDAIYNGEYVKV